MPNGSDFKALEAVAAPSAGNGPRDDFFCWKYQIWYPSEDCVYRHANKTYAACSDCFQGRMNLRHIQKGLAPPVVLTGPRAKPEE